MGSSIHTCLLYTSVIFLTVFIFIKLKTALVIRNLSNKVGVRFYYKFLGNIQWLKEQILMGKYLEMKYLNAVDDKNNSNIIIPVSYTHLSLDEKEIDNVNMEVLKEITGEYGVLEVINSGSVFELTPKTLEEIKRIVVEKNIKILYFEIYYGYIKRLDEIKRYFPDVEIRFRMGVETFDNDFRVKVYNKNLSLIHIWSQ